MAKSKQNNHEYYANYETCRNRYFDDFAPDELQNEDFHLDVEQKPQKHGKNNKKKRPE